MMHRIFVVFAFDSEFDMVSFKTSRDMDLVAGRKIAMMRVGDEYNIKDITELFDEDFVCYMVFELVEEVKELICGKDFQPEDAS